MTVEANGPEPGFMVLWRSAISCEELFKFTPTAERFVSETQKLPTDWAVRLCGFLEYVRDQAAPLVPDLQRHALEAFAPAPLRKDLLRHYDETGRFFLFEEQLLGVTKFAVLHGEDIVPDILTTEQQRAFFWALMMYGDLHSAENEIASAGDAARFEVRNLAFAAQEVPGNVMARAYALWVDLPGRGDATESKYVVNMPKEFTHATGGHPVTDYIAVVSAVLAHGREAVRDGIFESLNRWGFVPAPRFAGSTRANELTATLRSISANRAELKALFAEMPEEPRFLGVAMLPFAHRPVYVNADGTFLIISMRLLLDGLYSAAYWRVWEHLKKDHGSDGDALASRFSQFYGERLERYVLELVRSVYDAGEKRVFAEAEAAPPKGAADVAVILDDRMILFEVTRTELRYFQTLLEGDLNNVDADLARTAEKAKQVMDAEQRIRDGAVVYPGHENAANLPIERIVIVPEALPRFPFINERLRAALAAKGVDPDATIISVSELEEALRAGDIQHLSALVSEWKADPDYSEVSLHNFIQLRGKVVPMKERAPYIVRSAEAFRQKAIEQMAFDPTTGRAAETDMAKEGAPPPE